MFVDVQCQVGQGFEQADLQRDVPAHDHRGWNNMVSKDPCQPKSFCNYVVILKIKFLADIEI